MGSKEDEILAEVQKISKQQIHDSERQIALSNRLYDKDGDIPEIKQRLANGNGLIREHEGRISSLEGQAEATGNQVFTKKRVIGGISLTSIIAIIYGVGQLAGWW